MIRKLPVFLVVLLLAGFAIGRQALASISGSPHDFSEYSWNSSKEICVVCHTPHNATSSIAPLWNHTLTEQSFEMYSSPTLNAAGGRLGQPSPASKVCLSCHDGTVAVDSFGGVVGNHYIKDVVNGDSIKLNPWKLGTDLSNDHPISFTYDAALATADGALNDPTLKTVTAVGGKTIDAAMLVNHKVECSSCHDVHANKGDSPNLENLLVVNNKDSALCLTCHNK